MTLRRTNLYLCGDRLAPNGDFTGHADEIRFLFKLKRGDTIVEERTFLGLVYFIRSYQLGQDIIPRAPWRQHAKEF